MKYARKPFSSDEINSLRAQFGETVTCTQLTSIGSGLYIRAIAGGLNKISRGTFSLNDVPTAFPIANQSKTDVIKIEPEKIMTREEKASFINERFEVMDMLAEAVISGNVRSMIVSGAAGVGKSYTLEQKLHSGRESGRISKIVSIKGSISAVGLYIALWENRETGNVIVLDDADKVFDDEETMNIMKTALDSSKVREISWKKASSWLDNAGIPNEFGYEGQIVFISNTNFDKVVEKDGKMAPHMSALMSRAMYLDLGIHTNEEVMIRIEQVLSTSTMRADLGLDMTQLTMIMDWMTEHTVKLRSVSLRTVIHLAGIMKSTPEWKKIANNTLLKQRV